MAGLGDAAAEYGVFRQGIAFDQRHLVEMIGEHARRQQASDSAAENDCLSVVRGWVHEGIFLKMDNSKHCNFIIA